MSIAFLFTNPGHHLDMMSPVIDELRSRGLPASLISLAETQGFDTPTRTPPIARAVPVRIRRKPGQTEGPGIEFRGWQRKEIIQDLVWRFGLGPRLLWMLRNARVVVIPNDIGYPYARLLATRKRSGLRTVLLQEGIRFKLPTRYTGPPYGTNGTDLVCVWGEGSREYFESTGVPKNTLLVTGSPRMDSLDPAAWSARGDQLRRELGLARPPLAYLSNPIETQYYGPKQLRLECFETLLNAALPQLIQRGVSLVVKPHAGEDANDYRVLATRTARPDLVHVLPQAPLFAVLAAAHAAIVLASTVGLEALAFGRALGVLRIPGHAFPFEYVERGVAVPLIMTDLSRGLAELFARPARTVADAAFVDRHFHDRGRAFSNVADAVGDLYARSS